MFDKLIPWKKKDSRDLSLRQEDHPITQLRHDFDALWDRFWDDWQYVVIECKWEKQPIGPDPLNKLFAKLESRPGARGAVMSMTGFNEGAEGVALEKMSRVPIMLYGERDIRRLLAGEVSFEQLQRTKWETLIRNRELLWS